MITQDHVFEKKAFAEVTERGRNSCARCQKVQEVHPPSPDVERDLKQEEDLKAYALSLAPHLRQDAAQSLTALSNERANRGPIRDLDTRDFYEESAQEISDQLNYAIWWIRQVDRMDGDHIEERMALVSYMIGLYENWEKLQLAKHERR